MKKSFSKTIAVLLAVLMVVCSLPMTVFAANETRSNVQLQFGAYCANGAPNHQTYVDESGDGFDQSGLNTAKLDYNKVTGTITEASSNHTYGVGDFFTVSVLLENTSSLAASQVGIKYSDNIVPAALNKNGDQLIEASPEVEGSAGFMPYEAITDQSGNAIYNENTSTVGEISYIDADTKTMWANFAVQNGSDAVDLTAPKTVGENTFTNTAVLATFGFKIVGTGAVTFSLADSKDADSAYYLETIANGGKVEEYKTYTATSYSGSTSLDFMGNNDNIASTKYTVKFVRADGTVISQAEYAEGATVTVPNLPKAEKISDTQHNTYAWNPEPVLTATADATYTAVATAENHNWDTGVKQNDGSTLYTCTVCGTTKSETAHVHSWGEWTVKEQAVYNVSDTVMTRKCKTCNKTEDKTIENTKVLRPSSINLTLGSNIAVNLKVAASRITPSNFDSVYAVVNKVNSKTGATVETKIDKSEILQDGRYQYVYDQMNPQNMLDTYDIVFYAVTKDGIVAPGPSYSYKSIAAYAKSEIEKPANANKTNYKRMLVDMLKYGAAAQVYMNYNTDIFATSVLSEEQMALGSSVVTPSYKKTQNTKFAVIDNPTRGWKTVGLILDSAVRVRFKLGATGTGAPVTEDDLNKIAVKVKIDGGKEYLINYNEHPECFSYDADARQIVFDFNELAVSQIRNKVYYTICDLDGNALGNTMEYTAETFVMSKTGSLKTLLDAMMVYADSCRDYVAAPNA